MITRHLQVAVLVFAGLATAAVPESVQKAFDNYHQKSAKAPASLAPQFRRMLVRDLQNTYPELVALLNQSGATAAAVPGSAPPPESSAESDAIEQREGTLRSLPTDADRAKHVSQLAGDIRALPAGTEKIILASALGGLATEGDLGKPTLEAVASVLAQALREVPVPLGTAYLELASLVRYEHATPPSADPSFDAAMAVLVLRDAIRSNATFTLIGLDGKTYSLAGLSGHVVLLNFWATWCSPCLREMPDLEKLYQHFADKGLIVLAVSDEKRETVETFLAKQRYTFPIVLDPDRKAHMAYLTQEIPQTFLFDRQGKLVGQSVSMRTESQFLEMLKAAGLE